jgi:hypothetical protein
MRLTVWSASMLLHNQFAASFVKPSSASLASKSGSTNPLINRFVLVAELTAQIILCRTPSKWNRLTTLSFWSTNQPSLPQKFPKSLWSCWARSNWLAGISYRINVYISRDPVATRCSTTKNGPNMRVSNASTRLCSAQTKGALQLCSITSWRSTLMNASTL